MEKKLNISESVMPIAKVDVPNIAKTTKDAAKEKLQSLIKEESRMVKGIFQCFETPGASVKITVRKYPGIPHFEMVMTDGQQYEVPLYVARHLNGIDASAGAVAGNGNSNIGTCSYPVMKHKWSPGSPMHKTEGSLENLPRNFDPSALVYEIGKRVKRYGFQSMEFAGAIP